MVFPKRRINLKLEELKLNSSENGHAYISEKKNKFQNHLMSFISHKNPDPSLS